MFLPSNPRREFLLEDSDVWCSHFLLVIIFIIAVLRQPWVLKTETPVRTPSSSPALASAGPTCTVFYHKTISTFLPLAFIFKWSAVIVLSVILGLTSAPCSNIPHYFFIPHTVCYELVRAGPPGEQVGFQNISITEADTVSVAPRRAVN